MDYNDLIAKATDLKYKQQERTITNQELLLSAVLVMLSETCFTRFELSMAVDSDPSEAAKKAIQSLDRYDFLEDLDLSDTSYSELKKQIESDISNEAAKIIQEQNPR